jgi:hypothetical protein
VSLQEFIHSVLEARKEDLEEILHVIKEVRDILPSNAFYFTVSATCNED